MKMYPEGKGIYLWQIKRVESGNAERIAARAKALGFSWITIKVLSSSMSYNLRLQADDTWVDDLIEPLRTALHAVGIKLYGYQYIYLDYPESEAHAAVERIIRLGLDGFVIDAESQVYNKHLQAARYASIIRAGLSHVPIGLASFRYPDLHQPVPWKELLGCCSFHMPQVYWVQGTNPGDQLRESYNQLMSRVALPFVPTGSAYNEHGWKPTRDQLNEFNAVTQAMDLPGISWWEWYEAIENDFEKTIGLHDWSEGEDDPDPDPEKPVVLTLTLTEALQPGVYEVEIRKVDNG